VAKLDRKHKSIAVLQNELLYFNTRKKVSLFSGLILGDFQVVVAATKMRDKSVHQSY
jgi:uncharacterized membrane protein (UPF0136 family)